MMTSQIGCPSKTVAGEYLRPSWTRLQMPHDLYQIDAPDLRGSNCLMLCSYGTGERLIIVEDPIEVKQVQRRIG